MFRATNAREVFDGSCGSAASGGEVGMSRTGITRVQSAWNRAIKQVIARFARGNTSAQEQRILLPDEQTAERRASAPIARRWKARYKNAAS